MRGSRRGLSHRPRSVRCPETDALAPRPLPVRSAQSVLRGRTYSRVHRVRVRIKGLVPRATACVGNSTLCGIQWDFMGFNGQQLENGGFLRLPLGFGAALVPACSYASTLWLSLCVSDSERIP